MDAETTSLSNLKRRGTKERYRIKVRLSAGSRRTPNRTSGAIESARELIEEIPLLVLLCVSLAVGLTPGQLEAQVSQDINTSTDADTTGESEAARQLRELTGGDSVPAVANPLILSRMLVPGEGLQILPLGTSFAQVRLEFGTPIEEKTTGLLGKTLNLLYTADDGTDIILSGEDSVEEISVRGASNSTFMTREGLSFGAAALDIPVFYGVPDNSDLDETFDYPQQGIRFGIEAGLIEYIVLSSPVLE